MAEFKWNTTADFIANGKLSSAIVGDVIITEGYTTSGDGGGATWKKTATTGTASQSPAQLADALLNDAGGNQWELVNLSENTLNALGLIKDSLGDAANNALIMQAAYNDNSDRDTRNGISSGVKKVIEYLKSF